MSTSLIVAGECERAAALSAPSRSLCSDERVCIFQWLSHWSDRVALAQTSLAWREAASTTAAWKHVAGAMEIGRHVPQEALDRLAQSVVLRHVPVSLDVGTTRPRLFRRRTSSPVCIPANRINKPISSAQKQALDAKKGRERALDSKDYRTSWWSFQRSIPRVFPVVHSWDAMRAVLKTATRCHVPLALSNPILHLRVPIHLSRVRWRDIMTSRTIESLQSLHLIVSTNNIRLNVHVLAKLCTLRHLETITVSNVREYGIMGGSIVTSIATIPTLTSLTIESTSNSYERLPSIVSNSLRSLTFRRTSAYWTGSLSLDCPYLEHLSLHRFYTNGVVPASATMLPMSRSFALAVRLKTVELTHVPDFKAFVSCLSACPTLEHLILPIDFNSHAFVGYMPPDNRDLLSGLLTMNPRLHITAPHTPGATPFCTDIFAYTLYPEQTTDPLLRALNKRFHCVKGLP